MQKFASWLSQSIPAGDPIFVAFNAPFDWMFVNDYFHRYLGRNPFGHSALDIKALYMGRFGVSWSETSMTVVGERYLGSRKLSHNALQDARDQAEIFRRIMGLDDG
jgi:DNA polymerase III epsilon subunit-like protein